MPDRSLTNSIPRYLSAEPFPPYSYVPGKFPHPIRDPAGHHFQVVAEAVPAPDNDRWADSRPYLYGIDLFNHGYYWEAHETWESLWHACGRGGATGDFLKGLIKLAAGGVKGKEGRPQGTRRHAQRACELFQSVAAMVAPQRSYLGLCLTELIDVAGETADHLPSTGSEPLLPVHPWFAFSLCPGQQPSVVLFNNGR